MLDSPLIISVRYSADRKGRLQDISLIANGVVFNVTTKNTVTRECYGDYICTMFEAADDTLLGVLGDTTMMKSVEKVNAITLVDEGGNIIKGFQLKEIQLRKDASTIVKVDPKVISAFKAPNAEVVQFDCVNIPHEFDLRLTVSECTALRHALTIFSDSRECTRKVPREERDLLTEILRKVGG